RVLIIENGAYGSRFREIAEAYGIDTVSHRIAYGDYPDVKAIETLMQTNTVSHVFVIHHETTTGMLNPVQDIARAARRAGVRVVLDAMSSYAGIAIDVEAWGVDYLISSSNKCIQ